MIWQAVFTGGGAWVFVKVVTVVFGVVAVARLLPGTNRQVPGYRPQPWRGAVKYGGMVLALITIAGCVTVVSGHNPTQQATRQVAAGPSQAPAPRHAQQLLLGVTAPNVTTSYAAERRFASAAGRQPNIVLAYSAWHAPFNARFARLVSSHGAVPFIQLLPRGVRMSAIAVGRQDSYLRTYASQARAFGHRVIISFAPEPNGRWYRWGWTRTPAATWVAAWRHVVTVFRQAGADNVTWLWTVNITFPRAGPLHDYWPGAAYVDWVGIDGYFFHRHDTFASVFAPTVAAVRKLTRKPVLISETAVGPVAGKAATIPGLFAGIRRHRLLGLVWFDVRQHHGIYHQDWRLENSGPAIAAFRKAVAQTEPPAGTHQGKARPVSGPKNPKPGRTPQ